MAGVGLSVWGFTPRTYVVKTEPKPLPSLAAPTWHPATPVPSSTVPESNVVIPASAPISADFPTLKNKDGSTFDTLTLAGPGKSNPIQPWTKTENDAFNGIVTPPKPWWSTVVYDTTVDGGGLFGTDAQSSGRLLAHTTPNGWNPVGAFQGIRDLQLGDPVGITTANGKICYKVQAKTTVRKDLLNVEFSKHFLSGIAYIICCDRLATDKSDNATTSNLVVTIQFSQQLTNSGSC
jgi:hypothetical protein